MSSRVAAPNAFAPDWRTRAACHGADVEEFFNDSTPVQQYVQRVCQRCPVRLTCLTDAIDYEDSGYMLWGVVGGLTSLQRRALRCEALLGHRPDLRQAEVLASRLRALLGGERMGWPADLVAAELRKREVLATPVTVRVALWWAGGKASTLRPKGDGDGRQLWERVRDESREVVERLRGMGLGNRDVAAYLGVSEDALGRAVRAWRLEDEETAGEVAA
jgi:WhiB family redox-sensing transcriptional regulator